MIYLKYKLREITFNLNLSVLKAGFRKCPRRPQHRLPLGCELRELLVAIQTHPTFPAFLTSVEITGTALSVAG